MFDWIKEQTIPKKVNIFHYYWTRKVSEKAIPCADWMGACHGSDTAMLFGDPFVDKQVYSDEERNVSINFIKTISHFTKYGLELKLYLF